MATVEDVLVSLVSKVAELQRRLDGMVQQGPVHEVDPKAGTVRLRLSPDGDDLFLSPPIPYAQVAGALKLHSPPSVGQQMTMMSVGGDFRQALAVPMTWSDQNKAPGDKVDEHVLTFGPWTITLKGDVLSIKGPKVILDCEGASFELSGSGLKMIAPDYDFAKG